MGTQDKWGVADDSSKGKAVQPDSSQGKGDVHSQSNQGARDDAGNDAMSEDGSEDDILSHLPAHYFQPVGEGGSSGSNLLKCDQLDITEPLPLSCCCQPFTDMGEVVGVSLVCKP
ncbi:hypothetical protein GUJ93_ZPchr0011g28652 [Zizania palustris]|uniref:Uncharacterized protein n=1 Tax=Zizania palustris TaxID=103762 RepID=A0A8J5WJZ9_ZIZPA|nr:hypothetical protein GUJ93_ZPchr0011g28652 [Zizania palustris]